MSSVTYSLMNVRPLWMAKCLPTNSGTTVQARAQVLIGSRLPEESALRHFLEQPLDDVRAFLQRTSHWRVVVLFVAVVRQSVVDRMVRPGIDGPVADHVKRIRS